MSTERTAGWWMEPILRSIDPNCRSAAVPYMFRLIYNVALTIV